MERKVGEICRKSAREILEDKKNRIRVTETNLHKYLGKEKYQYQMANETDEVGIVRGLAWTSVGGVTLQIEVSVLSERVMVWKRITLKSMISTSIFRKVQCQKTDLRPESLWQRQSCQLLQDARYMLMLL